MNNVKRHKGNGLGAFAQTLIRLRTARGLSQHRLGLLAMTGSTSICRIETGERGVPTVATVRAFARAMDLTPADERALMASAVHQRHAECMADVDAFRAELEATA